MATKVLRPLGNNGLRVNLQTETAGGLVLCPSDLHESNFMIDDEGKLCAIDFGRSCFLPSSFMASLTRSSSVFAQSVARRVNYPRSANLPAMSAASGRLVVSNDNALGTVHARHTALLIHRIGAAVTRPPYGSIERSERQSSAK